MQWLGLEAGKLDPVGRFQPLPPTARPAAVTQVNTEAAPRALDFVPKPKEPHVGMGQRGVGAAVPGLGRGAHPEGFLAGAQAGPPCPPYNHKPDFDLLRACERNAAPEGRAAAPNLPGFGAGLRQHKEGRASPLLSGAAPPLPSSFPTGDRHWAQRQSPRFKPYLCPASHSRALGRGPPPVGWD